jgi:hypothetical protein
MPKSYRIRTSVDGFQNSDKSIRVQIDQDFDFLEVLSLKLTQSDVYRRFCSDYGVIVGRVVANGGFGVPNAKVSVFVPLDAIDENDPIISTLYPYKDISTKNEDGYRYNLLPYTPSYDGHVATGTFPTREDVSTRKEVLSIYEKYYKYTVKTNESGDYMIVGVPLGNQTVFLDVDLSDMGCFSLRPTDLIRMGRATEKQFDGNQFKSSSDLASLPQLVTQAKTLSVSSFWGVGDQCDVGITRVDFDLRDSNIVIEPVSTFMGSIMSSGKSAYLRNNCKPGTEQGDLCSMVASPGRILAIRQTINSDVNGDPVLEQYQLEQGGKVIDENGAFVVDVPMNLDYVTTNEFGELVLSNDPKIGIPTKGKYRFKIKWEDGEKELGAIQSSDSIIGPGLINLSAFNPKGSLLRANYLVPNIKEYGWENSNSDPNYLPETTEQYVFSDDNLKIQEIVTSSFAAKTTLFLDKIEGQYNKITIYIKETGSTDFEIKNSKWIDLPKGGIIKIVIDKKAKSINFNSGTQTLNTYRTVKLTFKNIPYQKALLQKSYSFSLDWDDYPDKDEAISCRDFFYEFNYNKVYTTAQLIDEYRKGTNRGRFLSIKEILERSCESEVNKFPTNDGVRNFDLLYFIIAIIFQLLSIVGSLLLIVYHIVKFLWNNFAPFIIGALSLLSFKSSVQEAIAASYAIIGSAASFGATALLALPFIAKSLLWLAAGISLIAFGRRISKFKFPAFNLPMITYPDCSTCDCSDGGNDDSNNFGVDTLSNGDVNSSPLADVNLPGVYQPFENPDNDILILKKNSGFGEVIAGRDDVDTKNYARTPYYNNTNNESYWSKNEIPLPERINLYNTKGHYFDNVDGGGSNRIKIFPNYEKNKDRATPFYEDQPLVFLVDADQIGTFTTGSMISFVNLNQTYDINILSASTVQNGLNNFSVTGTTIPSGTTEIEITYASPNGGGMIKKSFAINQTLYNGFGSYTFPSDIEYHQVVTATTVGDIENIVTNKTKNNTIYSKSFYRRIIDGKMNIDFYNVTDKDNNSKSGIEPDVKQLKSIQNYKNLGVVMLMKGVDPYTTRQKTKIDISKPFGLSDGELVVESDYKLNIPINNNLSLLRHDKIINNNGVSLFSPSYVFTASTGTGLFKYSAYTTHNHSLFSNFDSENDSDNPDIKINNPIGTQLSGYYVAGKTVPSGAWSGPNTYVINSPDSYFENEYVEGGGLMARRCKGTETIGTRWCGAGLVTYNTNVYSTGITMNMSSNSKIIMRSDRLPRSSSFDDRFVFAQNKSFTLSVVSDDGISTEILGTVTANSDFTTGQGVDFEEAYGSGTTSVISSFSCNNMVPLDAYQQTAGDSISVKTPKDDYPDVYYTSGDKDYPIMVNGCYRLVAKELAIAADLKAFAEWRSRFLMGFAICRNVVGMTFTNQWINGVLYMPGFQNDKVYPALETKNPTYLYCKDKIVFREENNSFFYRSSPYNQSTAKFIGKTIEGNTTEQGSNEYFLGNPTTMMDLGPKDNIVKFICNKPEFQGYNIDRLEATSYSNIGDITQLFIISRLSNDSFLKKLLSFGGGIGELFSRPGEKIDGDYAQLTSINSELGVVPFSPETYKDANLFFNATPEPIVGIFFSGDTTPRDLVTPGREIFIDTPTKFAYNFFGHNSQTVPMYKWELKPTGKESIFGSENNNWATKRSDFKIIPYQGIDRLNDDTYFKSGIKNPTTQRPGYIYDSIGLSGSTGIVTGFTYDGFLNPGYVSKFIVGAPFHFYFGLKVGKTAYDIFVKKNLIDL